MNVAKVRSRLSLVVCLLASSCSENEKPVPPPALPVVAPVVAEPMPSGQDAPGDTTTPESAKRPVAKPSTRPRSETTEKPANTIKPVVSRPAISKPVVSRPAASKPAVIAPPPAPAPAPAPAVVTTPVPAPKPAAAAKRVQVPRTANVHIEFPAGLQGDLDADPRMQKWVDSVVSIIDGCHAKNRGATGAIETTVTMHENERPDADIRSLPGQLSGVVACATGALMRVKMPLFTGREGTRYPVRIVFE